MLTWCPFSPSLVRLPPPATPTFAGPSPCSGGLPGPAGPALWDDRETQANPGISLTPHATRNTDQGPLSPGPCIGPQYTERRRRRGGSGDPRGGASEWQGLVTDVAPPSPSEWSHGPEGLKGRGSTQELAPWSCAKVPEGPGLVPQLHLSGRAHLTDNLVMPGQTLVAEEGPALPLTPTKPWVPFSAGEAQLPWGLVQRLPPVARWWSLHWCPGSP